VIVCHRNTQVSPRPSPDGMYGTDDLPRPLSVSATYLTAEVLSWLVLLLAALLIVAMTAGVAR
jgi:hypothetical protein